MRFRFGEHVLDTERRELLRSGAPIALEPQVFDLLVCLVERRDRVVAKDDLVAHVWGGRVVSDATIDSRINAARRAVGDNGATQAVIRTFARKGVRFVAALREESERATPAALAPSLTQTLAVSAEPGDAGEGQLPLALPDKPSIAVLPFTNLSGDPDQDYFADGMVEEIITALSRIRWLFVIARNSTFTYKGQAVDIRRVGRDLGVRYVLEGSVRKAGNRVRITAQFIEAESGAHLWADRFDGILDDVFELQDRIAISIAGVIEPTLETAEGRRAAHRPTGDLTAYDLYLRALPLHLSFERAQVVEAHRLLTQAIAVDPNFAPALALAAWCHVQMETLGAVIDISVNQATAVELATTAIQMAGDDATTIAPAAFALGRYGGAVEPVLAVMERALEISPSCARGWYAAGWLCNFAGQTNRAIEAFERVMRLNPLGQIGFPLTGIGAAQFFEGQFAAAEKNLLVALQRLPSFASIHRYLAAIYAHTDRDVECREMVARLVALSVPVMQRTSARNPEHRELFLSGLRRAERFVRSG